MPGSVPSHRTNRIRIAFTPNIPRDYDDLYLFSFIACTLIYSHCQRLFQQCPGIKALVISPALLPQTTPNCTLH